MRVIYVTPLHRHTWQIDKIYEVELDSKSDIGRCTKYGHPYNGYDCDMCVNPFYLMDESYTGLCVCRFIILDEEMYRFYKCLKA